MTQTTGARVDVEVTVDKDPAVMWGLVTDIGRIGEWSPECIGASWQDGGAIVRGARFEGRNRDSDGEWTVTCVVTEAEAPSVFEWVVLDAAGDPESPSSIWRYELVPAAPGHTIVRHSFVHGPGVSGVTMAMGENPDEADAVLTGRLRQLREYMTATIEAMARS